MLAAVDGQVDGHGRDYAAQRSNPRQQDRTRLRQLALHQLPLELQTYHEKEHRHESVVHPEQQWFVDFEGADLNNAGRVEEQIVVDRERRICDDHRQGRRDHQDNAAGGFKLQELTDGHEHGGLPS